VWQVVSLLHKSTRSHTSEVSPLHTLITEESIKYLTTWPCRLDRVFSAGPLKLLLLLLELLLLLGFLRQLWKLLLPLCLVSPLSPQQLISQRQSPLLNPEIDGSVRK
jgi:hypothetical protein